MTGSGSAQTISIYGSNFVSKPSLTLTWTNQPNFPVPASQVTFVSSTEVQMTIVTGTTPDYWTVKVTNPGGAPSNVYGFTVVAPTPTITSVVPNPVTGSGSAQTISIYALQLRE